jgi:hypothetical protein
MALQTSHYAVCDLFPRCARIVLDITRAGGHFMAR